MAAPLGKSHGRLPACLHEHGGRRGQDGRSRDVPNRKRPKQHDDDGEADEGCDPMA